MKQMVFSKNTAKNIYVVRTLLIVMIIFSFTSTSFAQDPIITFGASVSKFTNKDYSDVKTGISGDYAMLLSVDETLYFGLRASYRYFGIDTEELEEMYNNYEITAYNYVFEIVPVIRFVKPNEVSSKGSSFLQAGVGLYTLGAYSKYEKSNYEKSFSDSENNVGACLGIGVMTDRSKPIATEMALTYNAIIRDKIDGFITLSIGFCLL